MSNKITPQQARTLFKIWQRPYLDIRASSHKWDTPPTKLLNEGWNTKPIHMVNQNGLIKWGFASTNNHQQHPYQLTNNKVDTFICVYRANVVDWQSIEFKLFRIRFTLPGTDDYRPILWPIHHPYWCTGYSGNDMSPTMIAYVDCQDHLLSLWPEAVIDTQEQVTEYTFSDRFAKPDWFTIKEWPEKFV